MTSSLSTRKHSLTRNIRLLSHSFLPFCKLFSILYILLYAFSLGEGISWSFWTTDNYLQSTFLPLASSPRNGTKNPASSFELISTLQNKTMEAIIRVRANRSECQLRAADPYLYKNVRNVLERGANLIEYSLTLKYPNSSDNVLKEGITRSHKADHWSRVATNHGRTLLSLAFNYGILSLMTLKIGTEVVNADLVDVPLGCFMRYDEGDRIALILELLMKDFREDATDSLYSTETVCHEVIEEEDGYAKFSVFCCGRDELSLNQEFTCEPCRPNGWLTFLYIILATIRVCVIAFGPLFFLSAASGLTRDEFPYTVTLKEPLIKSIVLCSSDDPFPDDIKPSRVLNLRNKRGFPKLRESVLNSPAVGKPFQVKISQYDILVNYRRLVTENKVPIGFWKCIARAIFFCKIRHLEPFNQCCRTDMFRHPCCNPFVKTPVPWICFWRKVGHALLVLALPTPYYLRLLIFYKYEYEEVVSRKEAAHRSDLNEAFEYSLIHYLLPTHPVFLFIYAVYFVTAVILMYLARRSEEGRFRKIIVGSFTDLKYLSWIEVLKLLITNVIWPFRRYGLLGLPVALVYWPLAVPLTVIVYLFYCLPTVYLTVRMFFYSRRAFFERVAQRGRKKSYQVKKHRDTTLKHFDAERLLGTGDEVENGNQNKEDKESVRTGFLASQRSHVSETDDLDDVDRLNPDCRDESRRSSEASEYRYFTTRGSCKPKKYLLHLMAASLCVVALYAALVMLSECVGCLAEMLVFTTMGIIVNANELLKYFALIILVVAYSYDSFNNVEKRYLKLNKALFSEVKFRISDMDKVTSLPSYMQENHGFKSQELNEQADYEMPDDVVEKPARHWMINDLVLFVDNEDMPRIPKKLFEDVCQIRVAGVPGPIYAGLLEGLKQFLRILFFVLMVFVAILSFGSVYKVSSTNQMLAALAGGSLPRIMRTLMEPEKPDIEMGTVSFKSKLDEVIKNFAQLWPIYDFPFAEYDPDEETKDDDDEEDDNKKNNNKKDDKKGKSKDKKDKKNEKDKNKKSIRDRNKESLRARGSVKLRPKSTFRESIKRKFGLGDVVIKSSVRKSKPPNYNDIQGFQNKPDTSGDPNQAVRNLTSSPLVDDILKLEITSSNSKRSSKIGSPKVCFKANKDVEPTKVDLLIILPKQYDDVWLDEWSDIGDVSDISGPTIQMKQPKWDTPNDNVFVDMNEQTKL